jgi:CRP-like cAMP-binding protein
MTIPEPPANDPFHNLTPEQRAQIEDAISTSSYSAGHVFFTPDDTGDRLFVLQAGRVRLYKLAPEGRALTMAVLEPVSLFGEMTLVPGATHDSFAEAMGECVVGQIREQALRQLLASNPAFALTLMQVLGQRLRTMENKLADIAFKSVPQRLATVLLSLADKTSGEHSDINPPSVVRYTHNQLAEMIGSYRETVTKAIGEFREAGLIRIEDEAIVLTDLEKLQRLANA